MEDLSDCIHRPRHFLLRQSAHKSFRPKILTSPTKVEPILAPRCFAFEELMVDPLWPPQLARKQGLTRRRSRFGREPLRHQLPKLQANLMSQCRCALRLGS